MNEMPLLKETDSLIDYCLAERSAYAINDAVNDWLKAYSESENLILRLMSRMEDSLGVIPVDLSLLDCEIINVNEFKLTTVSKGLAYAYHLLVKKAEQKYRPSKTENFDRTFTTCLSAGQLVQLWQYLQHNGSIDRNTLADFRFAFSGGRYY